jgi:hypothetical protein
VARQLKATGWDTGLCQDYDKSLSQWFASRTDARQTLRRWFNTKETQMLKNWNFRTDAAGHVILQRRVTQSLSGYFEDAEVSDLVDYFEEVHRLQIAAARED